MLSKKQIALVHVARSKLGLSEPEYRAALESVGVESAKNLDQAGLDALMRHFRSLGFRPRSASRQRRPASSKEALIGKIEAVLADLSLPWCYAEGMARNMFGVDLVEWLTPRQLHKLVAALTYHQRRQGRAQ